jgi:hypothetical protein
VAVIVCELTTVNAAALPANITLDTPTKFAPLIVTCVPTGPLVGVKPVIVGGGITVKLVALTAVAAGVVTEIGPVVAPCGTVAMIFIPLNLKVALVPLKVTTVAPFKFTPLIVTDVPTPPLAGEKLVTVGGAAVTTVKFALLLALPPGVVTDMGPVLAPAGTVAVIWVSELTTKVPLTPLNATVIAPVNAVPVIITELPAPPLVGLKLVTVGGGITVKLLELAAVPPGVITEMGPLVAPAGTVAVICVSELTV